VGANPVDRGKPGSKLHLACDGGGLPPTAAVTAANVTGTTTFQAIVEDIPASPYADWAAGPPPREGPC
jgi:hypothetical protein